MDDLIARTGSEARHAALTKAKSLLEDARSSFDANDYVRAADAAREAVDLFRVAGESFAVADALGWLGAALTQQSLYQEALVQLNASLDRYRELGRPEKGSRPLNYMAIVHEELGDIEKAFALYDEALAAARKAQDREMEGRILANIGDAWVNHREFEKGLAFLVDAAKVLQDLPIRAIYAWCLQAIAGIYVKSGDYEVALQFFDKALNAAEEGGSLRTRAEVHGAIGSLNVQMGRQDQALRHLRLALEFAKESGVRQVVFRTHERLSEAFEHFGDNAEALRHYKEYHNERAAVFDEVAKAKIKSLTAEIELVKVRHEQEIFHLRNVELARANKLLEEQKRELQVLSVHDSLTGVYNRRQLDQQLEAEFERSRRYGHAFSIALIDADEFKEVNDRHSHTIGDATLKTIASVTGSLTRRSDLLARFGGDEFVIIFPNTPIKRAIAACEKVRAAIESFAWEEIHPGLSVTVSIGVASSEGTTTSAELLMRADERLYTAKDGGRNTVVG